MSGQSLAPVAEGESSADDETAGVNQLTTMRLAPRIILSNGAKLAVNYLEGNLDAAAPDQNGSAADSIGAAAGRSQRRPTVLEDLALQRGVMSESSLRLRSEDRGPGAAQGPADAVAVNGTPLPQRGRLSQLIAKSLQDVSMEDDDFRFIAKIVHDRAGIALTTKKRAMVYARLSRRVRELGMTSFREYRLRLEDGNNEDEMGSLVNALTTNYTKFFREEHHFTHMTEELMPALLRQSQSTGKRRMRIWSAGCSSGEEAYSIAMTLRHSFPGLESWDAKVLATDIDTSVLAHAESGLYSAKQVADIPPDIRGKFVRAVDHTNQRYRVAGHVRSLVAFKPLNLIEPWPMKGKFDVIFCRNVIIYFDKRTQDQLIKRFTEALSENGILYLGHSESPIPFEHRLKLIGRSIYRKQS
jgi:chemotaxis protein methyltransferase CheR